MKQGDRSSLCYFVPRFSHLAQECIIKTVHAVSNKFKCNAMTSIAAGKGILKRVTTTRGAILKKVYFFSQKEKNCYKKTIEQSLFFRKNMVNSSRSQIEATLK